jgi:hypothetical protein
MALTFHVSCYRCACLPFSRILSSSAVRYRTLLANGTADQDLDAAAPTDYDCRCFFLYRPRIELYRLIDARVEQMVDGGLLQVWHRTWGVW